MKRVKLRNKKNVNIQHILETVVKERPINKCVLISSLDVQLNGIKQNNVQVVRTKHIFETVGLELRTPFSYLVRTQQ